MLIEKFNGRVPKTMDELLELPGVGRKVAGCVMVYAHNKSQQIPIDTHCHRISNRLGWVKTKNPDKTEQELMKIVPKKYWMIYNETFVKHGKTICKPITPHCSICPVERYCPKIGVTRKK